ncbi:MAG: hypothetical protein RR623_09320 [Bacilli bacterium]
MLKKYKNIYTLLFFSIILITIFSESSPLYRLNPWGDANIFYTIGKGMTEGLIPYKDLFDHKGPILYFMFGLTSIVSSTSFFGVYILEILCLYLTLLFSMKILNLIDKEVNIYFILALGIFYCSSNAFGLGAGAAEEYIIPILQISLYMSLKRIVENSSFKVGDSFTLGVLCAIVFYIKYNAVGFFLGLFISLIIYQFNKNKKIIISCGLYAFLGFLTVTSLILVYFLMNNALKDFINGYFIFNLFTYASSDRSLIQAILSVFKIILYYVINNPFLVITSLLGIISVFFSKYSKYIKYAIILSFVSWYFVTFIGGVFIAYYILPIVCFGIYINKFCTFKNSSSIFAILIVALLIFTFPISRIRERLSTKNVQEIFSEEMYKYSKDPSLLMLNTYDIGFYLAIDELPSCKYFTKINGPLNDLDITVNQCINSNNYDYLIAKDSNVYVKNYRILKEYETYKLYINDDLIKK